MSASSAGGSPATGESRISAIEDKAQQHQAQRDRREQWADRTEDRLAAALADETLTFEIAGVDVEFHPLDSPSVDVVADGPDPEQPSDSEMVAIVHDTWGEGEDKTQSFTDDAAYFAAVLGAYSTDERHDAAFWRSNLSVARRKGLCFQLLLENQAVEGVDEQTGKN